MTDEARRDERAQVITNYVQRLLDESPRLTEEQRSKLAELLRPVRVQGGGDPA
jgi:hypothetical protein